VSWSVHPGKRRFDVFLRKWLLAAAVTAGTALGAVAAEPANKAESAKFTFGTLRAMPADAAKVRLEAWLKAAGKFDATKFAAVWAQDSRSVTDRALETITQALPDAATVLADAAKYDAPAPTEVPALLKDAKLDPFVKGTLAVAYARALGTRRVYEEALEALKGVQPEHLADPSAFYFYKAVAEHALIQRDAATASILRLLDDVADAPDRYKMVATLMFFDIQNWPKDDKELANIGKLMDNSGRRLDLARGGPKTQDIQKKIVFRLDEKIKELEAKAKGSPGQCNGGQCPDGGQPGNGGGANPSSPMQDSNIATNGGPGQIDEKKLRKYAEEWGKLPAAERAKAIQEITRDLPAKYKPMIEEYFKSLNRIHGITQ